MELAGTLLAGIGSFLEKPVLAHSLENLETFRVATDNNKIISWKG